LPVKLNVKYNNEDEKIINKSIWDWSDGSKQIAVNIPNLDNVRTITLGAPDIPDINDDNNILDWEKTDIGKL